METTTFLIRWLEGFERTQGNSFGRVFLQEIRGRLTAYDDSLTQIRQCDHIERAQQIAKDALGELS